MEGRVSTPKAPLASLPDEGSRFEYVDLVWPGKNAHVEVVEGADGKWALRAAAPFRHVHPLVDLRCYPEGHNDSRSLVVSGDRISALRTLGRSVGRFVRLAYLDLPRIDVDDAEASFHGETILVYSTWLTVVRDHLASVEALLRRDAVVVLHVGDGEEHYARLVADEFFRGQHVGTVVWQRAYAPRNMPNMKEFTATHDCLLIYAKDRTSLPAVGLRTERSGFANPDGDPRGEWKAEHKGAKTRRKKSDFDTYVPPYRWRVVSGKLPTGLWRVSPLTGVIWGTPTEPGEYALTVEVSDSDGDKVRKKFLLRVLTGGHPLSFPNLPWIFKEIHTKGALRIESSALPNAIVGAEYSAALMATGGRPFKDKPKRPGSGRYWEFADDTLLKAYQRDAVYLGRDEPTAIPHPKTYLSQVGGVKVENQQTWWPGRVPLGSTTVAFAGYTEDATKHLKALKDAGLIKREVSTGKPEYLLARLVDIFTDAGDTVLEAFGSSADLASVAIKRGRRFVYLAGSSERSGALLADCALPRLRAVVDGHDAKLESRIKEISLRADAYIPYEGGGDFVIASVGEWLVGRGAGDDLPTLNSGAYKSRTALLRAVLTLEGYLPITGEPGWGVAYDGKGTAVVLGPADFLTPETAAQHASRITAEFPRGTIYYFRASSDFDPQTLALGVACKRVPFDLGV